MAARVTDARVSQGRELLARHRQFLAELTRDYGVPGHYLVSFWGLETNFGGYLGKMPTLDVLATLACDDRRRDYFTEELLTALGLVDRESLSPATMKGSWAGAMGHTQFMPSTYQRYAIDGDGDGRIDLWGSERDALASAANYLSSIGWRRGERWGREVALPDDFPFGDSGPANRQPLAHWRELGVTLPDGRPLPRADMAAAVLVPSGHKGPAFLVYNNFDIIMKWNRSQWYALAVGHLADRINGAGPLHNPPPDSPALAVDTIKALQEALNDRGFEAGKPDGIMGDKTRSALQGYQRSRGMVADGFPGRETLASLGVVEEES